MPRYVERVWAGDLYVCREYFSLKARGKKVSRGALENPTSELQKKINLKRKREKLKYMIHTNFREGDMWLGLTYKDKVTEETAQREIRNFFRRLKRQRKKAGAEPVKYIYCTHRKQNKIHHHVILNIQDMTPNEIKAVWGNGRVNITPLEDQAGEEGYSRLAEYMTKEADEDEEGLEAYKQIWIGSRNLEQPKVEVVEYEDAKRHGYIKIPKGYKEVRISVSNYPQMGIYRHYVLAIKIHGNDTRGRPRKKAS